MTVVAGTCTHIRRETGMEVCAQCDYGTCPDCGARYIRQDSGDRCSPCVGLAAARRMVAAMEQDQRERQARYLA